jgi:hypothetical protein
MERLKNYFLTLNIFRPPPGSQQEVDEDPYQQRTNVIATRVYFLLLALILFIFIFITCLTSETINITVQNPTLAQIESIPTNRICPCSRISFTYDKFVSGNASFHQVCSSDFVSDRWISSLFYGENASYLLRVDFRSVGFAQFQALASFCRLSQTSVNQTLSLFGSTSFISSHFDSSPMNLHTKVMTAADSFQSFISTTFQNQIELISAIIVGNQFLNALGTSLTPIKHSYSYVGDKHVLFWSHKYGKTSINSNCICMHTLLSTDENCRRQSGIYEKQFDIFIADIDKLYEPTVFIPDFTSSCMPVDACLLSSLECFYNQSCVNAIFPYQRITDNVTTSFIALKSNNTSAPSRFNVSTRIKSIVDKLMVEEWLIQENYEKYFQQCAPASCTYLKKVYPDFLSVLSTLIGLLGGLCSVLSLVIPPVVKFIRKRWWPPPTTSESSETPRISRE